VGHYYYYLSQKMTTAFERIHKSSPKAASHLQKKTDDAEYQRLAKHLAELKK
jgi:hypothetical protein